MEWLRRLGVELLKESPSPSLRSCWALAQAYNTLARELFNAAFVSCWMELRSVCVCSFDEWELLFAYIHIHVNVALSWYKFS